MDETKSLSELVAKAKGEDRSIREYGRQSGVDPTVISKIITGKYIPKRSVIYKKLTSKDAMPRGDVTFEQLVYAANKSSDFNKGFAMALDKTRDGTLGWICPVCGRGVSPFLDVCPCKADKFFRIDVNESEMNVYPETVK